LEYPERTTSAIKAIIGEYNQLVDIWTKEGRILDDLGNVILAKEQLKSDESVAQYLWNIAVQKAQHKGLVPKEMLPQIDE